MRIWENLLQVDGWSSNYPSVDRYLRHYQRKLKSERTRKNTLHALSLFCRFAGMTPYEFLQLSPKEAGEKLQDFLDDKLKGERSIRYVNVLRAYLKTFFKVNGFKNNQELEVEGYHQPVRYRKVPEYIPTRDEIYKMVYAAGSRRNKALVLAVYTSGLRNSTLRALLYQDLKNELENDCNVIKVPVYPEMKRTVPGACKGNIPYYTFISSEAVAALKEYLNERSEVEDEDLLFCSATTNIPPEARRKIPVKGDTLSTLVKRAARRAEIRDWRHVTPHCLRKAFDSALRNSGIDISDREFLMGHVLPGSQDAYYDRSKIEELRTKYAKVRFLKTGEIDEAKVIKSIKSFAKSLGIENIEIKIAKLRKAEPNLLEEEAIGKIVREELIIPMKIKSSKERGNDPKKVIQENQLEQYLADGWDVQTILPSGKIIVKRDY